MNATLNQLLRDVAGLTGVAPPDWFTDDAPVLTEPEPFYLVGLIGGKDVGKSALVNALVGQRITPQTSFGPGTETAIAYAHVTQAEPLRALLESAVPGRYQIIQHTIPHLTRQVLVDLPDIDSHWGDHVTVTRKVLRHLLFPVWVQSIEKYADRQPQELLARVAAGNSPANFVFCLNKVDQLQRFGPGAVDEMKEDYAPRLQRVLQLGKPPRVWGIAAVLADQFELPELRDLLMQQKTEEAIKASRSGAAARQKASVLAWLEEQDLPARAARLQRMEEDVDDLLDDRLATPLLDGLLPKLLDDPTYRHAIIDECLGRRISHWPILNIVHPLFASVGQLFRRNAEEKARPLTVPTGEALVDQQIAGLAEEGIGGRTLAERVQTCFALLQQTHPSLSALYRDRKLWDAIPAAEAANDLRDRLVATVNRQRAAACANTDAPPGSASAALRGILTIGAVLWFPFLQPIVHTVQVNWSNAPGVEHRSLGMVIIELISLQNFIQSLTGLLLYFLVLWVILRWSTQRRVLRQFARWKQADAPDPNLSVTAQIVAWLDSLVTPIREMGQRTRALADRVEQLRNEGQVIPWTGRRASGHPSRSGTAGLPSARR